MWNTFGIIWATGMINLSVVCDSLFIMFWSTQGCLRTWQLTKNILASLHESLFPVIISKTNLCPLSNFTFFRFLVKDFFYGIRQGSNGLGIKDLKRLDKHKNLNWGNTYCFFCCRIANIDLPLVDFSCLNVSLYLESCHELEYYGFAVGMQVMIVCLGPIKLSRNPSHWRLVCYIWKRHSSFSMFGW